MLRLPKAYGDVVDVLGELIEYLIEFPIPDSFGNLLISTAALGPQIGAIQNTPQGAQLFGGYIVAELTVTREHTIGP
jgi:hypothetical protein